MKTKVEKVVIAPEQLHKKQSISQVLLPVIAAGIICVGVCLTLLLSTSGDPQSVEKWAQISTMFLIIPTIIIGLAGLAILILLGNITLQWNKNWPPALRSVRLIIINFEKSIQVFAQKPAQPIIGIKSALAGFAAIFKK